VTWLAALPDPPAGLTSVTRPLLERYLAVLHIISAAKASWHARVAEMNRHVADNLDKIITTLEAEGEDGKEAAAGAS
jgi:hypothetical protein